MVGALAAPHVARAQQTHNWSMAMSWPKGSPGVGVNAERCARMIEAMSGGRIRITLYGAGELVPPFEVFDAVAEGTAQLGHGSPYFWQGKNSVFQFFSGVPFGLTAAEHSAWLYFGGAQALWDRAYEPFGVVSFYAGSSGPQAGGWFARPIESLDDLRGLNMRIAGLGGEVMRRLGVNVVLLPPGEIFGALQAGTIDAAEWIGPWNDLAFGLYRIAKYYYMPAFHEFGPALELMVNARLMMRLTMISRRSSSGRPWRRPPSRWPTSPITTPIPCARCSTRRGSCSKHGREAVVVALAEQSDRARRAGRSERTRPGDLRLVHRLSRQGRRVCPRQRPAHVRNARHGA
jgi:TRAP-type mannitol/chloroaromatic compound transport system substrate-binding protein